MKPLPILLACLVLASCATPERRAQIFEERMNEAALLCSRAGFKPGTPEIAQCAVQTYSNAEAAQQARDAQMMSLGVYLLTTPQQYVPPPPRPVNCWRNPYGITTCL